MSDDIKECFEEGEWTIMPNTVNNTFSKLSYDDICEVSLIHADNIKVEPFEHSTNLLNEGNYIEKTDCCVNDVKSETCKFKVQETDILNNLYDAKYSQEASVSENYIKKEPNELYNDIFNEETAKVTIKRDNSESGIYSGCDHTDEDYQCFCLKCHMLLHVLNNCINRNLKDRKVKTLPRNILEIKELNYHQGVFALKCIPEGVIFGPYTGLDREQCISGYLWRLIGGRLAEPGELKCESWMRYINVTDNALEQNLNSFQCDGNLYYQSSRQISNGEELMVYYIKEHFKGYEPDIYYCPPELVINSVYACIPCCLGFSSETYLQKHITKCVYKKNKQNLSKEIVQCLGCKIYVSNKRYLKYHVNNCENIRKNKVSQVDQSFQCHTCNAVYKHKSNLSRHMLIHADEKRFVCYVCDYKCHRKGYLRLHIMSMHTREFACQKCDYIANRRNILKLHMINEHNTLKRFKSTEYVCWTGKLQKHQDSREDKKNFECSICNKTFTENGSLKRHIRVHTGEKPYVCEYCNYRCAQSGSLVKHVKTHTGERPHSCHICSRRFLEKCKLRRHMKVHSNRKKQTTFLT